MLNTLRFKSSVLFGTHNLSDKSLRVLQLPTHLSNLTANGYSWNSLLYSLRYKLIRVGWILHFRLFYNTRFVWLSALTMIHNNNIHIFVVIPNTFYNTFFIKYLCIYKISLVLIDL